MKEWRLLLLVLVLSAFALTARAAPLTMVSDLISYPSPGALADHTITFTTNKPIPASGSITITPEDGAFNIPSGTDYTDVDFAVWNGSAYIDRSLAANPSSGADGVSVTTGSSGNFVITLSSSAGIAAGARLEVKIGSNATFGSTGTSAIFNPGAEGSYHVGIVTKNASAGALDSGDTLIVAVNVMGLVLTPLNTAPSRSNGLPSGIIAAGSSLVELSLNTDGPATCRYSTTPNTEYLLMTNDFTPLSGQTLHTALVSGLTNGTTYAYYVRCNSLQNAENITDYPISFSLAPTPISDTSVTEEGGTIGSGPFVNGSSVLFLANVTLTGFAAPQSTVVALEDGTQVGSAVAKPDGTFTIAITNLERGTYTFSVYQNDTVGKKSSSVSLTQSVTQGTNNTIAGIMVPPTVSVQSLTVDVGSALAITGHAALGSRVALTLTPSSGSPLAYSATTTALGAWEVDVPAGVLTRGTYTISATITIGSTLSNPSTPLFLGVGQSASPNLSSRSDVNGDKKVNLVDFSIMLSHWGTSDPSSDINGDGKVNLADFSILLFNWTG